MALKIINDSILKDIADAIRGKQKVTTTDKYKPSEMAGEIEKIETGADISDTTATASDVLTGKAFYTSDGTKTDGELKIYELTPTEIPKSFLGFRNYYIKGGIFYVTNNLDFTKPTSSGVTLPIGSTVYIMENNGLLLSAEDINILTPNTKYPAEFSDSTFYKTDGTGYAISDFATVTPGPIPQELSHEDMYKIVGSGMLVSQIAEISPIAVGETVVKGATYYIKDNDGVVVDSVTQITPSNSSPVSLSNLKNYFTLDSGYAISSYTSKTSTMSPAALSSGSIYKMDNAGYLIKGYQEYGISPTSTGRYFYQGWNYFNSAGYAYSSQVSGKQCVFGEITLTNSSSGTTTNTITCGFQPTMIFFFVNPYCAKVNASPNVFYMGICTYYREGSGEWSWVKSYNATNSSHGGTSTSNTSSKITTNSTGFTYTAVKNIANYGGGKSIYLAVKY